MKGRQTKIHRALLIIALLCMQPIATTLHAEDTNAVVFPAVTVGADTLNAVELIKQLQKRIDELEQKVNALEGGKAVEGAAVQGGKAVGHAAGAVDEFLREAGARSWQRQLVVPVLSQALTASREQS